MVHPFRVGMSPHCRSSVRFRGDPRLSATFDSRRGHRRRAGPNLLSNPAMIAWVPNVFTETEKKRRRKFCRNFQPLQLLRIHDHFVMHGDVITTNAYDLTASRKLAFEIRSWRNPYSTPLFKEAGNLITNSNGIFTTALYFQPTFALVSRRPRPSPPDCAAPW
jgi:hypothetical protein